LGYITGNFLVDNQTFKGMFYEVGIFNTSILKTACGKSIKQGYNNLVVVFRDGYPAIANSADFGRFKPSGVEVACV